MTKLPIEKLVSLPASELREMASQSSDVLLIDLAIRKTRHEQESTNLQLRRENFLLAQITATIAGR